MCPLWVALGKGRSTAGQWTLGLTEGTDRLGSQSVCSEHLRVTALPKRSCGPQRLGPDRATESLALCLWLF